MHRVKDFVLEISGLLSVGDYARDPVEFSPVLECDIRVTAVRTCAKLSVVW